MWHPLSLESQFDCGKIPQKDVDKEEKVGKKSGKRKRGHRPSLRTNTPIREKLHVQFKLQSISCSNFLHIDPVAFLPRILLQLHSTLVYRLTAPPSKLMEITQLWRRRSSQRTCACTSRWNRPPRRFRRRSQFWFHSALYFLLALSEVGTLQCCSGVAADLPLKITAHSHKMQNSPWKCIYIFFIIHSSIFPPSSLFPFSEVFFFIAQVLLHVGKVHPE